MIQDKQYYAMWHNLNCHVWGGDLTAEQKLHVLEVENEVFELELEQFKNEVLIGNGLIEVMAGKIGRMTDKEQIRQEFEWMHKYFRGYGLQDEFSKLCRRYRDISLEFRKIRKLHKESLTQYTEKERAFIVKMFIP